MHTCTHMSHQMAKSEQICTSLFWAGAKMIEWLMNSEIIIDHHIFVLGNFIDQQNLFGARSIGLEDLLVYGFEGYIDFKNSLVLRNLWVHWFWGIFESDRSVGPDLEVKYWLASDYTNSTHFHPSCLTDHLILMGPSAGQLAFSFISRMPCKAASWNVATINAHCTHDAQVSIWKSLTTSLSSSCWSL